VDVSPENTAQSTPPKDFKYWAFITYSHKDEKWAAWLHRSLEHYYVPRSFVGSATRVGIVPKRLYPIFRDRDELPSSSSLSQEIQEALVQSRNLLIVCSPHAVVSHWVKEEILSYKRLGRSSRVFCFIVDGEPNASDDPLSGLPEAFPEVVRFAIGPQGELTQQRAEPIAADVRKGKDGKHQAKLKLVAGMLDIKFGDLIKRDARRRFRQRVIQMVAAVVVVAVIVGIWWRGKQSTLVEQQRADEQTRVASTQTQVASMRALASRAKGMFDQDPAQLQTSILLATEALHRAIALQQPADVALSVMRQGLALLPRPPTQRIDHEADALNGVYSHDGRWLATLDGKRLRLWEAGTSKQLNLFTLDDDGLSLAFSPDDHRLLTVSNNAVQTWDPTTHIKIADRRYDNGLSNNTILSPDAMWLASSESSEVFIWEVETGKLSRTVTTEQPVTSMVFSPNGRFLLTSVGGQAMTGPIDPGAQLWDITTGKELARHPHETWVEAIAFSNNSRFVATGSGATIQVWNTANGQKVATLTHPDAGDIDRRTASLAFAADGRWLAGGAGSNVHVWEVATRHEVARLPGAEGVVTFSTDGSQLLTADGRIWEMSTAEQLSRLTARKEVLVDIGLGARGTMLATGSQQGGADVWEVNTNQLIARLPEGSYTTIRAFSADGRFLATMSGVTLGSTWSLRLWEVKTGRKIAEVSPEGQISIVAFSPDGNHIVTGDNEGKITIFATTTATSTHSLQLKGGVSSIVFSPDGETLALASDGGDVLLWNPTSDGKRRIEGAEKEWPAIAFSANGRYLAVGGPENSVLLLDPLSGKELLKKSFKGRVVKILFSADGRTAVAATESAVYVWETTSGKNLAEISPEIPKAESNPGPGDSRSGITDAAFSEDGEWLVIAWQEQPERGFTVELWHAPTGRKLATLERGVEQVVFNPDNPKMATLTKEGVRVEYWHPKRIMQEACASVGRDFTEQERQLYFPGEKSQPTCRDLVVGTN
jgi:WD40 repeat protein